MKYIFVTGGVVSGLGKGICAASLGRLLKQCGLRVRNQKFDPYLNVDPGTMSPYQHGEVFVTDDGAETDLDLGHYERFVDEALTGDSSVSSGKIFWSVLNRERQGGYLGGTVQIIPHVTDEIKRRLYAMDDGQTDVVIAEIGGTVGDIESQPYLEAIRQVAAEQGRENVLYIHVPLVVSIPGSGELKSKPTQHSVKELLSVGIQPDKVTGSGSANVTAAAKATYGTDYTFTLTPEANYAYTVEVTAGGKSVTPDYDEATKTYTIPGKEITGNVVITVNKEANKAQINFTGNGAEDVEGGQATRTATPGQNFVFKINKVTGYTYTVTATKADNTAVTVTENPEGTYTIAGADIKAGDVITITVEKKQIETKYTIEVNEYVKLDKNAENKAQSVFLITAKLDGSAKLADGKVLAYGNDPMFRNAERYEGAYAYLVISDKSLAEVKAEAEADGKITEVDVTAQTFNINGDVNGTGLVDINDAQLVYNIYNAKYDSFDTTTMAMFLAADVNNSKTVDVKDAAAVVAKIQ